MEVVGVVAAIPGLIEIVQGLTTAVRGLAKGKVATKASEALLLELKDLEETLKDLQRRWRQNPLGQSQLQRLSPALAQLRAELSSIKDKLQSSKITKDPVRFFQKAVFLTTSLDKTLKESLTRITQAKTSLTLILAHHHDRQARANHLDRILCLYGIKGCGKSVLVKSIAERLTDMGEIALHFSFWAGSETQRKLLDLLRTILWQLLGHLPDVQVQHLSTPLVTEPSLNEHNVLDIIHKALHVIQSDIYCIIDGIDESTDNWTSRRDRCLQAVFALVEQHPKIHLLVSGREPTMRTLLKESPPTIEVTESLVQHDMRRFISVELQDALTIQNAEVEALVRTTLEAKSQIMFLWAALVFKELRRCYSIREIKKTLSQVPRDLDREYYRLFQQLMDRTGGTLTKPSVSMKRAHRILSTILACAEPLTAQELCYAYAAQENTSGNIEDDLIAVEGITDSCGDFLRVTEGRYHLVHTSAADFLIRPSEEWKDEDSDIEYFRVDPGDSQQSMCAACLGYMNTLDWGYPLTDNGARDLPSKYPFFLYSTKFLPYHLAKALDLGRGSWANSYVAQFTGTRQACFFVEYVTFIVQNGLQDGEMGELLYWFELLGADIDIPTSAFIHAYQNELEHRRRQFGFADSRYESWRALSLLFPVDLLQQRDLHPLAGVSSHRISGGKNWGDVEDLLWQALGILDQLPQQPQNQGKEVAKETACRLRDLIGKERKKTSNRMWEYFLCNTMNGMQYRTNSLYEVAEYYFDKENYAEAASWAGEAVACIDTILSQDEGLEEASDWYEELGEHYAEVGDRTAAEVVLSDVASRYLADFSCPFSTGLTLASTAFLYRRRFTQRRVLLLSANEAWRNSEYPDLYSIFSRESSFAKRFTKDAELLGELSAASALQASFVHQAYEHLTRARDANDQLEEGDHDGVDKDATGDQKRKQKRRHETILDLEDRLKLLGSGPLPPKVTDGNQEVTKENRNLRRVKSLQLPGTSRPLQRRLSLELY
ncbi:hypothetical protein CEP54_003561 [Fusarium duplospermum]|uniref:Nephrocystin 3-like N-terminal domain-containing protein n=1 Tax=Fusarium duplospermum TaxID=1325734 RepID=A0A428QND8_9HYPO|nr:hypothetical protein CEP54_003561 [Fusarium duplospermum]